MTVASGFSRTGVFDMAIHSWLYSDQYEVDGGREVQGRVFEDPGRRGQDTLVPYMKRATRASLAGSILKEVGDAFGTGERWDADGS